MHRPTKSVNLSEPEGMEGTGRASRGWIFTPIRQERSTGTRSSSRVTSSRGFPESLRKTLIGFTGEHYSHLVNRPELSAKKIFQTRLLTTGWGHSSGSPNNRKA